MSLKKEGFIQFDPAFMISQPPDVSNQKVISYGSEKDCDIASEFDYCMIIPANEEDTSANPSGLTLISNMLHQGLELKYYLSRELGGVGKRFVIVLIRASLLKLRKFADYLDYKMLCDPTVLRKLCEKGNREGNISEINIPHIPEICQFNPYECIYVRYSFDVPEDLYWRLPQAEHPFRMSVRLKLTVKLR